MWLFTIKFNHPSLIIFFKSSTQDNRVFSPKNSFKGKNNLCALFLRQSKSTHSQPKHFLGSLFLTRKNSSWGISASITSETLWNLSLRHLQFIVEMCLKHSGDMSSPVSSFSSREAQSSQVSPISSQPPGSPKSPESFLWPRRILFWCRIKTPTPMPGLKRLGELRILTKL